MLSYNDQLNHQTQNEQSCRRLYAASRQHQAMNAAIPRGRHMYARRSLRFSRHGKSVIRFAFFIIVLLLSLWVSTQVAIAADAFGGEVMGGEVMGGEVMGGEVMGGEVMGGESAPENAEQNAFLSRLILALGLGSSASAPRGVNYY